MISNKINSNKKNEDQIWKIKKNSKIKKNCNFMMQACLKFLFLKIWLGAYMWLRKKYWYMDKPKN
jgi:hypothetical protein